MNVALTQFALGASRVALLACLSWVQGQADPVQPRPSTTVHEFEQLRYERGNWIRSKMQNLSPARVPVGVWIWTQEVREQQTSFFRREFDIPAGARITAARALITADNAFTLYLDGAKIGQGSEWRILKEYDLSPKLGPGKHTILVEAFNDTAVAGMVFGLRVEFEDGTPLDIVSDREWIAWTREPTYQVNGEIPQNSSHAVEQARFRQEPWQRPDPPRFVPVTRTGAAIYAASFALGAMSLVLLWFRFSARKTLKRELKELLQGERARIARDIHDELGAGLTQLRLIGELARRDALSASDARQHIERLAEKSEDLMLALDEIVWTIDPRKDNLPNLVVYLGQYARNFLSAASIHCRFDIPSDLPLDPVELPRRQNVFLAVKEALNNVVKHSQATEVVLRISLDACDLVISVMDNGRGFDPDVPLCGGPHDGLKNIRERLKAAHGDCVIESVPGTGTTVRFQLRAIVKPENGRLQDHPILAHPPGMKWPLFQGESNET